MERETFPSAEVRLSVVMPSISVASKSRIVIL